MTACYLLTNFVDVLKLAKLVICVFNHEKD